MPGPAAGACRISATRRRISLVEARARLGPDFLDANIVSQVIPGRIKIDPPVYADHIAAGSPERLENPPVPVLKWITGTPGQARDSGPRMGKNEPLVVFGGQTSGPTVEELHSFHPGCDLSV